MNLSNEVIALIIGLITSVLVPFLNRKFGNNPMIGQAANVIVDELESQKKPGPLPTYAPLLIDPPVTETFKSLNTPPNEDGAL